jgi:hypothetical protein
VTRDELLAAARARGCPREWLFFRPGPDDARNPEGGFVVEAPAARGDGRWRVYHDNRGVKDEAFFAEESAAYEYLLGLLPDRSERGPELTREQFLAEVERRGGRSSWFVFLPDGPEAHSTAGRIVVEQVRDGWQVYRSDDGPGSVERFPSESAALRHLLASLLGRPA